MNLNVSVLEKEISLENYKTLYCDRNRHRGSVTCYVRKDLSYNILYGFPHEIENIFLEILLPNSKPITVRTFYCPTCQGNFLEVLNNNNMNKINSVNDEICILGDLSTIF